MPLLLETIRAFDGQAERIHLHQNRMRVSSAILFGKEINDDLASALSSCSPIPGKGVWKIRVLYDRQIRKVESAPYTPVAFESAALVNGTGIDYRVKWADRSSLQVLEDAAHRKKAGHALILVDGQITDFSFANAFFFDGKTWWTPSRPLLEGTRRTYLLETGRVQTRRIIPSDLGNFTHVCAANAMLDLGELTMPISNIIL